MNAGISILASFEPLRPPSTSKSSTTPVPRGFLIICPPTERILLKSGRGASYGSRCARIWGSDEVRDAVTGHFCGGCADGAVRLWPASGWDLARTECGIPRIQHRRIVAAGDCCHCGSAYWIHFLGICMGGSWLDRRRQG